MVTLAVDTARYVYSHCSFKKLLRSNYLELACLSPRKAEQKHDVWRGIFLEQL